MRRNFEFYGAKHVAILCVPKVAGNEEVIAGDMAMFAQNMMLSLTARGYGSIPQLAVGMFGGDIRKFLGVSDDYKMLWAVSFGVPDWDAVPNKQHLGRVPVEEIVKFHR
ncbi:MAG: nitroreductase family protein [Neisseria sp.]|nr:nitroreductase family protein [Neisseria sp.]